MARDEGEDLIKDFHAALLFQQSCPHLQDSSSQTGDVTLCDSYRSGVWYTTGTSF
jgi:hypothetical protein